MLPPKPIYSYISAGALALVTLFTFYVYRDFGPQSVIRRFHLDIEQGNNTDLTQVVTADPQKDPYVVFMKAQVRRRAELHATFQILGIKRLHREVLATVEYRFPNGYGDAITWHVSQGTNDWRVDCEATLKGIQQQMQGTP